MQITRSAPDGVHGCLNDVPTPGWQTCSCETSVAAFWPGGSLRRLMEEANAQRGQPEKAAAS